MLRLSDNDKGWEYALATSHRKISPLVYEFHLRKMFFKMALHLLPIRLFKILMLLKAPFTFTNIDNVLLSIQKVSDDTIRLHLKKPYGMFMRDLARIYIYSQAYLERYGWGGAQTGSNMKLRTFWLRSLYFT